MDALARTMLIVGVAMVLQVLVSLAFHTTPSPSGLIASLVTFAIYKLYQMEESKS